MRAVLDPNVIISALLSDSGAPAEMLRAFVEGEFEIVVSPNLLKELARALDYPKLRRSVSKAEAAEIVAWLKDSATTRPDPDEPPATRSADPADDYLIALAAAERVALVSGDKHLLQLADDIPVFRPRAFLELLRDR